MTKLSTGQDSTLGNYRELCAATFGESNGATKYFDEQIKEQGENMEVVAPESQVMILIFSLQEKKASDMSVFDFIEKGKTKHDSFGFGENEPESLEEKE